MSIELNVNQVKGFLRVGLSAGGPFGAIILAKSGMSHEDYGLYLEAFLYSIPAFMFVWTWLDHRVTQMIQNLKPGQPGSQVATVVVKDEANGKLGDIARSGDPKMANIVTETQNEFDAKQGTKV